jgi:hypothetical protein
MLLWLLPPEAVVRVKRVKLFRAWCEGGKGKYNCKCDQVPAGHFHKGDSSVFGWNASCYRHHLMKKVVCYFTNGLESGHHVVQRRRILWS